MEDWLRYISIAGFAFAAILITWKFKQNLQTYGGRCLAVFVYFNLVCEIESLITRQLRITNITHFYVYCILETLLFPVLLVNLSYMKKYRKIVYAILIVLVPAMIVEVSQVWLVGFNTITRAIECVLLVALATVSVFQINAIPKASSRSYLEEFWLCMGMTPYFAVHTIVILALNFSMNKFGNGFGARIWMFNSIGSITCNIILIWGILKIYRHKQLMK